jgi:hypothetical protein
MTRYELAAYLATIGAVAALAIGCGPKCRSDDLGCFLDNIVFVEPKQDGEPLELVDVDRDKVQSSNGQSSSGSGGARPDCFKCDGADGCVYTGSDPHNCGACGNDCALNGLGDRCNGGECECGPYRSLCNGQCVDLQSDPGNCGSCGETCSNGTCLGAMCAPSCPTDLLLCPAQGVSYGGFWCVDPMTSSAHCGGCGIECPPAYGCAAGRCVCEDLICMDPTQKPQAPTFGGEPLPPISFSEPRNLSRIAKPCTDPHQCTPAVCVSLCSAPGDCESTMRCMPPIADGKLETTWETYMGFLAEPSDEAATFTVELTPVSGPGCGKFDPHDGDFDADSFADWVQSGDAAAGPSVTVEATVELAVEQSASGSGGYYCSGQVGFCPGCGTVEACCSSSDCYYQIGNGSRFPCNGTNCNGAAQAVVSSCCPTP